MSNHLCISMILLVSTILATLFLLAPPVAALPTGYNFAELGCDELAGIAVPSIHIKTNIAGTGDFLIRQTNSKYETSDLQATDIGYTSTDLTNKRFVVGYTLDQYYTDTTPSIIASHYLETTGSSISKEEAGISYTAISENASNAITPTSVTLTSGYTSLLSNGGEYAAETKITSSLASDNQPHTLVMNGQTDGYGDNDLAQGATFWDWSASYKHRLSNTMSAPNISGNESVSTHEIGVIGGDHAVSYSFEGDVSSRVKAIVFKDKSVKSNSNLKTPLAGASLPVTATIEPTASSPDPTETTTEPVNETANMTANITSIQENLELSGYNIANYTDRQLNLQ